MADKDTTEELQVDEPDLVDATFEKEAPEKKSSEEETKVVKEGKEDPLIPKNFSEDSNSDNSAVMVEHKDVEEQPRALQIVKIGNEEDAYAFSFQEDHLGAIVKRIPAGMKVSVVSVVGAFRTGKSFLLSFFLKYLSYLESMEKNKKTGETVEGATEWYKASGALGNDGFHWRGGSERNTTGIWMWSQPYFVNGIAVLLVDTQGTFDNETTMNLTSSIFGLSTLLSSYQIYNVDKMIGEDSLQQLSLFTEYARTAALDSAGAKDGKPFQKIEFLVRDWQHFEEEEDVKEMAREMEAMLEKVMADRDADDLQETREQINMCFDDVSAYGLTHPGFAVTKKSYGGEIEKIEPIFLELLDQYVHKVLDNLEPKKIHGRELTGEELPAFVKCFANMFASGAKFPEAATMLEATAGANNTNATDLAMKTYKESMDRVAGPQCSNHVKPEVLAEEHKQVVARSMEVFNSIANFGSKRSIEKSKRNLIEKIDSDYVVYAKLNDSRNPFLNMEIYALPALVALGAYIARTVFDWTCSHNYCQNSSEFLSHLYAGAVCFIAILASTKTKQLNDFLQMGWAVVGPMVTGVKPKSD